MSASIAEHASLFVGALLVHNVLLMQGLGLAPPGDAGGSPRVLWAVSGVIIGTAVLGWGVHHFLLQPLALTFLELPVFVLVIVGVAVFAQRILPLAGPDTTAHRTQTLVAANSAALGVLLGTLEARTGGLQPYGLSLVLTYSAGAALGVVVVSLLLSAHAQHLASTSIPRAFRGAPITFVTVGITSLAFMGFAGIGS